MLLSESGCFLTHVRETFDCGGAACDVRQLDVFHTSAAYMMVIGSFLHVAQR